MEIVFTPVGIFSLAIIVFLFVLFSRNTAQAALSLPCVTLLTSIIYYYVMPSLSFSNGRTGFLGVYIESMASIHWGVLLYVLGASAAFLLTRSRYALDPAMPRTVDGPLIWGRFWLIAGVALLGLLTLKSIGRLNLSLSDEFRMSDGVGNLAFLQLSISLLLPITIVYAVHDNFGLRAWAFISASTFVFLVSGFRFRIAILMIAIAASFSVTRGVRIRVIAVVLGTIFALIAFNAIGMARRYGAGLDLSVFKDLKWEEMLNSFGGEEGPIFAFLSVIEAPPPEWIAFDPWTIAIARLVPSFLWPDKPSPYYLYMYTSLFDERVREYAGIAGPQQAEMMLQFGWFGIPLLSFLYFILIGFLVAKLMRLGREARIAGMALVPGVFGFYMQQRGYFFQNISEALFILGPLFLMHKKVKVPKHWSRTGGQRAVRVN